MIALATIAYNEPGMISEQIRLLAKYLDEPYRLIVFDNTEDDEVSDVIRDMCEANETAYLRPGTRMHHEGLNAAAAVLAEASEPYYGFLDHDIFPTRPTKLTPLIEPSGFYGVGQQHPASGRLYPWPGFCFFSREWLAGRPLDFSGIRGKLSRDDGDTGSCLWPLFEEEDWRVLYRAPHRYEAIRRPDGCGLQSWGVEWIGDWLHLTNASKWMKVPKPEQRDRLVSAMLAAL